MISAAEFAAYNREVARIGDRAAADVESSVLAWCRSHEDATVAEKREAAKLIMEGFVQGYDDVAAEFAAQWYDHRAEQGGARLEQAVTMTTYGPDSVDAVARYQARKLVKGGDAAFAKACGEFARNDAFRSLNETIAANVGRDKDKGVRFARVPTGFETCTFCLMLASRGAVYHTRKTAGELKRFHRNCDCKIVPGFEGDKDAELVEGVRPKELVRKWWLFEKIDATEGLSSAERNEMKRLVLDGGELPEKVRKTNPTAHMRKVGRSSSGWISAGERLDREVKARGFRDVSDFYEYLESRRTAAEIVEAGVLGEKILDNADATPKFHELVKGHLHKSIELVDGVSPKELRERYRAIKQIDSMEGLADSDRQELAERALRVEVESIAGKKLGSVKYVKPRDSLEGHEKAGIDNLLLNGFDIETIKEDPHAPANLDISMNGELWEMKNLTNRASSVSNQVKRARIKWFKLGLSSPSRCVFTNEGNEDGFDETCAALEKRRRPGEVFLAVSNRGVVRVLSDK